MAAFIDAPTQEEVDQLEKAIEEADCEYDRLDDEVRELERRVAAAEEGEEKKKMDKDLTLKTAKRELADAKYKPLSISVKSHSPGAGKGFVTTDHKPTLQQLQQLKGGEEIVRIIDSIAYQWENVAMALGFDGAAIERIKKDAFFRSLRASRDMFIEWLDEGEKFDLRTPITWSTLIECLREANLAETAKLLETVIDEGCSVSMNSHSPSYVKVLKTNPLDISQCDAQVPEKATPSQTPTLSHTLSQTLTPTQTQTLTQARTSTPSFSSFWKIFRSKKEHKLNDSTGKVTALQRFRPSLIQHIHLPRLLPHLSVHGVITDEEFDALKDSQQTHVERIIMLLSFMEKRGESILQGFLHALMDEKMHSGHQELVKILSKAKEPLKPPNEFTLPDLRTDNGYEYAARSPLGLVQLPSSLSANVSIEAISGPNVHPHLNSNEILITPIFHFCQQDVSFQLSEPAILELMKSIVPTDQNPRRQLVPLYSSSGDPLQWNELISHNCEMLDDRVRFKTTQFGFVSVMVRFPFPSASVTFDPIVCHEEKIEIEELPGFKMEIPPVSVQSTTRITTTVLYQDPQVTEHFKDQSLASACIKLEPHNTQFQNKVKITLPIPNHSKIMQKYPDAKLELWHAKSTDEGVPVEWEAQSFTIDYDDKGNCLATTYITHFSYIAAIWTGCKTLVRGFLNFFVFSVRGRCQVFMSHERRLDSSLSFGIAVLCPWPHSGVPNYPHCLFDSVEPIEIMAGDVECQIDIDDDILRKFSGAQKQKDYRETAQTSDLMRTEFKISLNMAEGTADCELPSGPIATLLIKHGSQEVKPYKYNLIKLCDGVVPVTPTSISSASSIPDNGTPPSQVISHPIAKAAQKLTKATRQLKQNVLVLSAGRIAKHMQKIAEIASGDSRPADGNIADTMQLIVKESKQVETLSRQIAKACTEPGLKKNILDEVDKISATAQQLKILSKRMDKKDYCSNAETAQGAIDLLTTNATNLMSITETVLYAAERAILKVPQTEIERLKIVPERIVSEPALHELDMLKHQGKVVKVIDAVAHRWERFATRLHFTFGDIKRIEKECRSQPVDACQHVVGEWLSGKGRKPTSWSTVIEVLEEIDLSELAKDLTTVLQGSSR